MERVKAFWSRKRGRWDNQYDITERKCFDAFRIEYEVSLGNRIGKPVVMCLELWFIFLIIVLYVCWIWIIKFLNIWVFKYTNNWILKKAFFNAFCVWERWHGRKIFSETTRRMQEVCKTFTQCKYRAFVRSYIRHESICKVSYIQKIKYTENWIYAILIRFREVFSTRLTKRSLSVILGV